MDVYGIYPLNDKPNIEKLKPMKQSGRIHCVAERVTWHFTNALRGNKLADLRRQKINEWGLTVKQKWGNYSKCGRTRTDTKIHNICNDDNRRGII